MDKCRITMYALTVNGYLMYGRFHSVYKTMSNSLDNHEIANCIV